MMVCVYTSVFVGKFESEATYFIDSFPSKATPAALSNQRTDHKSLYRVYSQIRGTFWLHTYLYWCRSPPMYAAMSQSTQPTDPPSSTTEDDELTFLLRQKVWQGKLPTTISLAANESKSFTNTTPLYVSPLPQLSPSAQYSGVLML